MALNADMKRTLQVTLALLSFIPLFFGLLGMFKGVGRFLPDAVVPANLDSQFRFLSAWYLGLTGITWWMLPNIERHTGLVRIICAAVFLGGIARVFACLQTGAPEIRFLIVGSLELLFPLIALWQNKLAQTCAR
jgi:hypothetical protein